MVGRDVELIVPKGPAKPGEVVLSVQDLQVRDDRLDMAVDGVDLEVRAGEIVVIAGVQGNGQTELVEAIVGLRTVDFGRDIDRRAVDRAASPRKISDLGVAHIPEDRGRDGLIGFMTVAENYVLDTYHRAPYSTRWHARSQGDRRGRHTRGPGLRHPDALDRHDGRHRCRAAISRRSSSRASSRCRCKLVIAAQPTRGLDVGSIEYIHRRLVEQRDAGAAILIVSTELDEVLAVGDRIAVMFEGRIVGIVSGADATYENLGMLMGGASFGGGLVA